MFKARFKRIRYRHKLSPEKRYRLLIDIEAGKSRKSIAKKYGVTEVMVGIYARKYFDVKLVRKPVQWPYPDPVLPYVFVKQTRQ